MTSFDPARAGLPDCFVGFQARVREAAASHPEMPSDLVILSRLFGHVYMRMESAFDTLMERWGLSAWSWLALMVVYSRRGDEVTPSDLSRTLFLARANVTRVSDELVRRGLLHRESSTRDRRVLRLSLTVDGETLVNEIMPHAWDLHRAIWSRLPAAQLGGAQAMLCAILAGIEAAPLQRPGAQPASAQESA